MIHFDALDCKKCGGNDFILQGKIYKCAYCGTNHTFINDELVKQKEKDELIEAADTFLEWNEYEKAQKKYQEVSERWPNEPRSWWGLVQCSTKIFQMFQIAPQNFEAIESNYKKAYNKANPIMQKYISPIWDDYAIKAKQYINQQREDCEKENFERQERNRKEREAFKAKEKKKFKIKSVLTLISVLILITANIAYIILALSLRITETINSSPACIAPVIIGGFIAMIFTGISSGISRFPGLVWLPAAINGVCVLMMIVGMISHSRGFFDSALVIICFGAVGIGVTCLIGWLSVLIMNAILDNCDADCIANNICK